VHASCGSACPKYRKQPMQSNTNGPWQ
jgi:hypothetical protein